MARTRDVVIRKKRLRLASVSVTRVALWVKQRKCIALCDKYFTLSNRKIRQKYRPSDEEKENAWVSCKLSKQTMPQLFPFALFLSQTPSEANEVPPYLIIVGTSSSLGESTAPAAASLSSKLPLRLVLSSFSFLAANLVSSISINRSLY